MGLGEALDSIRWSRFVATVTTWPTPSRPCETSPRRSPAWHTCTTRTSGAPGPGRRVMVLQPRGGWARRGWSVLQATGSRSFTQTVRKVAGQGSRRVQSLFKYFNQFIDADRNGIDVLICDEAHRIRETSEDRFTAARHRTGRPQIDELMAAARAPVFLLDDNQVVKPGELGSVPDIRAHGPERGLRVHRIPLDTYF